MRLKKSPAGGGEKDLLFDAFHHVSAKKFSTFPFNFSLTPFFVFCSAKREKEKRVDFGNHRSRSSLLASAGGEERGSLFASSLRP